MASSSASRRFAVRPAVPHSRARRNTPFYRLKTPSHQVAVVLSALAEGLDPSEASRVFGFRHATITSLSNPCWRARTDLARALLLQSPAPTPAVARTAHQAPLRHTGALALAGHRPLHENSTRAPSGSAHATRRTERHPFLARALGSWLPAPFHSRWLKRVLLGSHGPFRTLAPGWSPRTAWTTVARRGRPDLRPGEEKLPTAQAAACDACEASWHTGR